MGEFTAQVMSNAKKLFSAASTKIRRRGPTTTFPRGCGHAWHLLPTINNSVSKQAVRTGLASSRDQTCTAPFDRK